MSDACLCRPACGFQEGHFLKHLQGLEHVLFISDRLGILTQGDTLDPALFTEGEEGVTGSTLALAPGTLPEQFAGSLFPGRDRALAIRIESDRPLRRITVFSHPVPPRASRLKSIGEDSFEKEVPYRLVKPLHLPRA